jgi:hypothetical protein
MLAQVAARARRAELEAAGWRVARPIESQRRGAREALLAAVRASGEVAVGLEGGQMMDRRGELAPGRGEGPPCLLMVQQVEEVMEQLLVMFPGLPAAVIKDLLEGNQGDVGRTVDKLLLVPSPVPGPGAKEKPPVPPRPPATPRPPVPPRPGRPAPSGSSAPPCPECPVCYEPLLPPARIFHCTNGHLVCQPCHDQPALK